MTAHLTVDDIRGIYFKQHPYRRYDVPYNHACSNACSMWKLPDKDVYICEHTLSIHYCGDMCTLWIKNKDTTKQCQLTGAVLKGTDEIYYDEFVEDKHGNNVERNCMSMKDAVQRKKPRYKQSFNPHYINLYFEKIFKLLMQRNQSLQKEFTNKVLQAMEPNHYWVDYPKFVRLYWHLWRQEKYTIININTISDSFLKKLKLYTCKFNTLLSMETHFTRKSCYIFAAAVLFLLAQGFVIGRTIIWKTNYILHKLIPRMQFVCKKVYNIRSKEVYGMIKDIKYVYNRLPQEKKTQIQLLRL